MNAYFLANVWCSGDLPFRPKGIAKWHVLRIASRSPVRAVEIYEALLSHGSPSVAQAFRIHLESYCSNPFRWWWFEVFAKQTRPLEGLGFDPAQKWADATVAVRGRL